MYYTYILSILKEKYTKKMRPFLNDHQKAVVFVCSAVIWMFNQKIKNRIK